MNQTNKSSAPKQTSEPGLSLTIDWYWNLRWAIGVFIITGNATIIIIVVTRRRLRNAIPNQFIVSLAVADFFMGAVIIPVSYYCTFHEASCDWSILYTLFNFLLYSSICNLCVMTLDRFLAVVFPYAYQTFMTQRKALVLMAVAWVFPTISMIPVAWKHEEPSLKASYDKIFSMLQCLLVKMMPCVLMIVTNIPIYMIVRKHSRQIACQSVPQATSQSRAKAKNERSTVKVFTLVVFLFILCYCFSIFRDVCKVFDLCKPPLHILRVSRLFYLANSAINPVVYSFLKRDIRREMKGTLISYLRWFGAAVEVRNDSDSSFRSRQPEPREMTNNPALKAAD